jgi:hypothetical protein
MVRIQSGQNRGRNTSGRVPPAHFRPGVAIGLQVGGRRIGANTPGGKRFGLPAMTNSQPKTEKAGGRYATGLLLQLPARVRFRRDSMTSSLRRLG